MTVRHAWVAEQVSLGACLSPLTHTHTVRVPSPRCPHQDSPLLVVAAGHGNGNIPMEHTLGEKHRQRPQRLASSPCITMATQNVPTLLVVTAGDGNGNIPAEHIPGELHRRGRSTESQAHAMRWQYSIPKPRWLHVLVIAADDGNDTFPVDHIRGHTHRQNPQDKPQAHAWRWQHIPPNSR